MKRIEDVYRFMTPDELERESEREEEAIRSEVIESGIDLKE